MLVSDFFQCPKCNTKVPQGVFEHLSMEVAEKGKQYACGECGSVLIISTSGVTMCIECPDVTGYLACPNCRTRVPNPNFAENGKKTNGASTKCPSFACGAVLWVAYPCGPISVLRIGKTAHCAPDDEGFFAH